MSYVEGSAQPSLVVGELSSRTGGLWVGPNQGGHVASLKITPTK